MGKSVSFKEILERYGENAKKAMQAAMEAEAEKIVQDMKSRVPVRSGRLRDSIHWKWNRDKTAITIVADAANGKVKYARIVEFSPKINKPFFFPALDAHIEEYHRKLVEALRSEAGKAGK